MRLDARKVLVSTPRANEDEVDSYMSAQVIPSANAQLVAAEVSGWLG